ncbi:cytochrome P450 [Streptomyces sp. NPDC058291]|uniref:cytochrome P450 n=1 Tax=Streptomyces sp. NPDC058291 TaxID=3346427 RepID=UPI0036E86C18
MTRQSTPQDRDSALDGAQRCPVTQAAAGDAPPPEADGPTGLPLAWPVVGSTILYAADPPDFAVRAQRAHGTVVKLPMIPHNPTVQVTDPEAVRRILQGNADNYCRGAYYEAFRLFMGHGLLTLDDGDWREHRKVVNPAFAPNAISARAAETDAALADLTERWADHARAGRPFDLYAESMRLTCRVIGHALVGRDLSRDGGEFARALSVALEAIFKEVGSLDKLVPSFLPTPYRRRVRRARRTLEHVIAQAARDADQGAGGEVAALIRASDLPADAFWSDLVTLMLAGVETTALALAWTLYETARHPEVRDRLEEEADRSPGLDRPTPADLDALTYTGRCVDEALRLHPPVWQFPRQTIGDDVLAGRRVPAGTPVLISVYAAHRNPEQWADPESFDPERFGPEACAERDRSAYVPFGGGRRQCIGKRMGLGLLRQAVATVHGRFRLTLVDDAPRSGAYITLFPKEGIRVTAQERRR